LVLLSHLYAILLLGGYSLAGYAPLSVVGWYGLRVLGGMGFVTWAYASGWCHTCSDPGLFEVHQGVTILGKEARYTGWAKRLTRSGTCCAATITPAWPIAAATVCCAPWGPTGALYAGSRLRGPLCRRGVPAGHANTSLAQASRDAGVAKGEVASADLPGVFEDALSA